MLRTIILIPMVLAFCGCCNTGGDSDCSSDTDCKGDRICVHHRCKSPGPKPSATTVATQTATVATQTTAPVSPPPPPVAAPLLVDLCFNGTLGEQAIAGTLNAQGNQVDGYYYYAKYGPSAKLKLNGSRNGNAVALAETGNNGKTTGTFDGTVTAARDRFSGTWSNPGGARKLPFEITTIACQ